VFAAVEKSDGRDGERPIGIFRPVSQYALGLVQPSRDLLDEGQRGFAGAVAVHFLCIPVDIIADACLAGFFGGFGLDET
jgi:hypothetical protein